MITNGVLRMKAMLFALRLNELLDGALRECDSKGN